MRRIQAVLLLLTISAAPGSGEQLRVTLDPAATTIEFALGATLHTVHGEFRLASGELLWDPTTGAAVGEIVIDATSGQSGNQGRDRDMHRKVIESSLHPTIVLEPDRIQGRLPDQGSSTVEVTGRISLCGTEHPVTFPAEVSVEGGTLRLSASFEVPYVAWGLRDPSKLVLRVAKVVTVSVSARGELRSVDRQDR